MVLAFSMASEAECSLEMKNTKQDDESTSAASPLPTRRRPRGPSSVLSTRGLSFLFVLNGSTRGSTNGDEMNCACDCLRFPHCGENGS